MFLDTSYTISVRELFCTFNPKIIKTPLSVLSEVFKTKHKQRIAAKVFTYFVYLILQDIIDNNVTFKLPTRHEAYLEMRKISGDDFVQAKKNGAFKDIDYLASNFCAYHLQYRFMRNCGWKEKFIYVNSFLKKKIVDNTNNGKKYY